MALTLSKLPLSGSTQGKGIKIAASSTPGTTVHTAVAGTTDKDEVWLWAYNNDTVSRDLTVEYGGTSSPDNIVLVSIPSKAGLMLVVPGLILQMNWWSRRLPAPPTSSSFTDSSIESSANAQNRPQLRRDGHAQSVLPRCA